MAGLGYLFVVELAAVIVAAAKAFEFLSSFDPLIDSEMVNLAEKHRRGRAYEKFYFSNIEQLA